MIDACYSFPLAPEYNPPTGQTKVIQVPSDMPITHEEGKKPGELIA